MRSLVSPKYLAALEATLKSSVFFAHQLIRIQSHECKFLLIKISENLTQTS